MTEGWLYNMKGECGEGDVAWDNDILSEPSKVFLPILFVISFVLLIALTKLSPMWAPRREATEANKNEKTETTSPTSTPADSVISPESIDIESQAASNSAAEPRDEGDLTSDHSFREGRSPEGFLSVSPTNGQHGDTSRHIEEAKKPAKKNEAPRERLAYIDFTRILCVACVVTEHSGGGIYSHENVVFVQQWVMPFLFLVSGLCYSMSRVPLWMYVLRLTPVFLAGTCVNWIADILSDRDWQGNFMNTIFQMMYVLSLMAFSTLTEPLKRACVDQKKNPNARPARLTIAATILTGLVGIGCFVALFLSKEMDREEVAHLNRQQVFFETAASFGIIGLATTRMALVFTSTMIPGSNGIAFWLAIATIYLPAIVCPYPNAGAYHSFDLFFLGVLAAKWKLPGQAFIKKCWQCYWPFILAVLLILSTPHIDGRCDLNPHNSAWVRTRFFIIEVILVSSYISKAFVAQDPSNLTGILNVWALFAYITHVAWDRLLPRPAGALVTYGFLVAVLVVRAVRHLMGRQETIRI